MLRLFSALILLCMAQLSFAETDLLNLSGYKEGDIPSYAKHVVIKKDEATGEKWLTGDGNEKKETGQLIFPVNLSGNFDVTMRLNPGSGVADAYLTAEDELNQIHLDFCANCVDIKVTDKKVDQKVYASAWGNGVATMRLSVSNNIAKIYVNELLYKKADLKPDLKYTKLTAFISSTRGGLYELYLGGAGNTTTNITDSSRPTNPSSIPSNILLAEEFEKGKQEGIQQCVNNPNSCGISVTTGTTTTVTGDCIASYDAGTGELNIPCINVPGAFGQLEMYDIWLKQLNGSLNFELDLNRITAK